MNLNNVYLPHFCRPCYHKKSLMDLILVLLAHFVLIITLANAFIIKNSSYSSLDAQLINHNHHHSASMPSKNISYELTVMNNPLTDHHYFNKTNHHHNPINLTKLNQLDLIKQEQLNQLNQVNFLNQLNKVNINPINLVESLNQIKQKHQLESLKSQIFINQINQEHQQNQLNEHHHHQQLEPEESTKIDLSSIKKHHQPIVQNESTKLDPFSTKQQHHHHQQFEPNESIKVHPSFIKHHQQMIASESTKINLSPIKQHHHQQNQLNEHHNHHQQIVPDEATKIDPLTIKQNHHQHNQQDPYSTKHHPLNHHQFEVDESTKIDTSSIKQNPHHHIQLNNNDHHHHHKEPQIVVEESTKLDLFSTKQHHHHQQIVSEEATKINPSSIKQPQQDPFSIKQQHHHHQQFDQDEATKTTNLSPIKQHHHHQITLEESIKVDPFNDNQQSQQSQINEHPHQHIEQEQSIKIDPSSIKQSQLNEFKNEIRDGFVVLTSAHNSKYPGPMFSRNVYSQSGSSIQNDFYQKYYTPIVTNRPPVKEYHQPDLNQQNIMQNVEPIQQQISQLTEVQQQQQNDIKSPPNYVQNYNSNTNNSLLNNNGFLPDDKPEEDTELEITDENNNKGEFNNSKSFFELFGSGITSYDLKSNLTNLESELNNNNKTLFDLINLYNSTTSTNRPSYFDLTAEDSNYRPFISNNNNNEPNEQLNQKPNIHGTRPSQPINNYELFKEYPLINNSNIIINQFHSTPNNWTRPESNRNQTKIYSINPINKRPTTVNLPPDLSFLQPLLANYSSSFNLPNFKPTIITEFANEFLTNLSSSSNFNNHKNDLENSDSSHMSSFFNLSSPYSPTNNNYYYSSTSTQAPIESLDKNQFDIPLSPVWNSVADQLISSSTTQSPLSIYHHPFSSSSLLTNTQSPQFIHVSASDLVTAKRNHSQHKFPFKQHYSNSTISPIINNNSYNDFNNNTHHLITSSNNNVPNHISNALRLPTTVTPPSVLYSATQNSIINNHNNINHALSSNTTLKYYLPMTSTSTTTPSTITPEVYQYIYKENYPNRQQVDHNFTTFTNNHNFDETIHYNNPLRLASNPKLIQPLTLLVMSYLASKSSIGANLITRNDQPSNSSSNSNGSIFVDWFRGNRKKSKQTKRSNKKVTRQQKQRSSNNNNNNNNNKLNLNGLPISLSNIQLRPISLDEILLSNQITNQLTGTSTLNQQFPTLNPFFYPSTRPPLLGTSRLPSQMIFETKRHRPSSNYNYIPEELLNDHLNDNSGLYTADDYGEEYRGLLENTLNEVRLNNKLLNSDNDNNNKQMTSNKNSGSSSVYRTHRNSQSNNLNSRNSRTPPESSGSNTGSNINSATSHSLDNELNGHSSNTPAPRCDKFTQDICVDDFEYPESAILEEIDRKREFFKLLYSEVKGEVSQVDGLTRMQEQALSWDNQFGSNNYLNDSSNESTYSATNNSPNRNSYLTMDDDLLNNDKTAFRFSSLIKDSSHNSKSSGFICSSEILYGKPKLAKNVKNQWKVIVNAGKYTQTVRMEKCLQPNRACSLVQPAALAMGATSKCAQVNAFHRLMVFEKGRGFYIDTFKIPSSCACYVHSYGQQRNKIPINNNEYDSEELSSNTNYKKVNRKRIDNPSSFLKDKNEIDGQTINKLQYQQQNGLSLPTSIFNQPFILNDLNNLQRNKLQTLFPTFGQRVSNLNNNNQQPAIELRPLYLKNGETVLAKLLPLPNNDNNNNNKLNQSLIEKLSISGTVNPSLNPALAEQQQRELNQLVLDLMKFNSNSPKVINLDKSKMINLEDLIRSHMSLAQVTPNNLLDQLNSALFSLNRQNEGSNKNANRRKNTPSSSSKNNLLNSLANNQKIGLLYLEDDKNPKINKLKALPVVKLLPMLPQNQMLYGKRFVDKRRSEIAKLLMANKGNYSNLLNNNNNFLNKNPLIVRDNAFNLETPISALKIITPDNLMTQSPVEENENSKERNGKDKEATSDESDEDEEKMIDEIDAGNLLGNMEDQEDKEDGEVNYAEMNGDSNHGESSEQENNTSKHDQNNEHLTTNELNNNNNEEEPTNNNNNSNELNDHEHPNNLDDHNNNLPTNSLDTNSSLFTFENISNGPKRKLINKLKPKLNNNNNSTSYVSVSGFKSGLNRNSYSTTESNLFTNSRSKFNSHEQQQQQYYNSDNSGNSSNKQKHRNHPSITSTTSSYLADNYNNSNEWSGSSSSSTIFTPSRTFKRKYNTTTISPIYTTSNLYPTTKRKQNDDILMFGYKTNLITDKFKNLTKDKSSNHQQQQQQTQQSTTNQSAEQQTSNQTIERLAIEETENRNRTTTRNELINKKIGNDRTISEILSEKVNFNYHPIMDFINRKD